MEATLYGILAICQEMCKTPYAYHLILCMRNAPFMGEELKDEHK